MALAADAPRIIDRTLWVLLVSLIVSMTLFTRIPGLLVLFIAAMFVALLYAQLVRSPVVWAVLGVFAITQVDTRLPVWIGDPDRMAGAAHWIAWLIVGLSLPHFMNERRWRQAVVMLGLLGAFHATGAFVDLFLATEGARSYGFTQNPGILGLWCMSGAIAASWLAGSPGDPRNRTLWALVSVLCFVGLGLSGTRAAFLGLFSVILVFSRLRSFRLRTGVFVLLLLMSLVFVDEIRRDLWVYTAWEVLKAPLGHGVSTFYRLAPEGLATTGGGQFSDFPHNMVLQTGYDFGWLGLVLLGAFVWLGAQRLTGVWRAYGVAFGVYSLFWLPSPAWFLLLALLIGRTLIEVRGAHGYQT